MANGHTTVEKELRKFLKVRNAKCNTGADYVYNANETIHCTASGPGY